ncbi:PaaX family transcriptional regulator C-terminal domain-containing protein [Pleionea sp. CnH1-48]|uniref:PaaX family transcriptional regulator C-terminal domain-containing protein n=1 Tax=Pleionea sp. CnH1-48 TaxID=2954494 RepID=UPI002096B27F|nr:PaaX family transcriptional regulator C-terminal domain-containing protein [Pleionea sp. CnH1-48]MCO7224228.1 PaaX family transcriptional regulator [Pleionea sp. CnH1-48]
MKLNTKRLILSFITGSAETPVPIQRIIDACAVFGIKSSTVRVTITRLVSDNVIQTSGRGFYEFCIDSSQLAADVRQWRNILQRLGDWQQDWIGVHSGGLGRVDRKMVKQRERSLHLNGFRNLRKDFYVRPNNLKGGVTSIRERLHQLGLEEEALVFRVTDFDTNQLADIHQLWNVAKMEHTYVEMRRTLNEWLDNLESMSSEEVIQESFLLGEQAIRLMVFDPLLPDSMIDGELRLAFFNDLLNFDTVGRDVWRSIIKECS